MITATAKIKMGRSLMALVLIGALSLIGASPVNGFTYWFGGTTPHGFGGNEIKWCIDSDGPWYGTSLAQTAINSAAEHWDSKIATREIRYVTGDEMAFPNDCNIEYTLIDFSAIGWGTTVARTTQDGLNFLGNLTHARVYLNSDHTNSMWFSTASQNCYVGYCSKPLDFYTIVSHEFGHALGLGENKPYTTGQCVAGYHVDVGAPSACANDFYTVDVMYIFAADGYRRWVTTDSQSGVNAIY